MRIDRLSHRLSLRIEPILHAGQVVAQLFEQFNDLAHLPLRKEGNLQIQVTTLLHQLALSILCSEDDHRHHQGTSAHQILQPGKRGGIEGWQPKRIMEQAHEHPQSNEQDNEIDCLWSTYCAGNLLDEPLMTAHLALCPH